MNQCLTKTMRVTAYFFDLDEHSNTLFQFRTVCYIVYFNQTTYATNINPQALAVHDRNNDSVLGIIPIQILSIFFSTEETKHTLYVSIIQLISFQLQ
ncbi:unnamed protein product [Adineta ricciae]|uniref:Uncharacterized protein n=1 Tax=Adineta ricciae TaxID=249248 RepID=A0A815E3H7_ADIRI|nr:unnamed protein product [Adineta ricciae]